MNQIARLIPFLFLAPVAVLGQSREETMKYIIDELRSMESRAYTLREVSFSPSGDTFTYKRQRNGLPDKGTVIPLAKVDIYCVTVHRATGIDYANLVVRPRGKDGEFIANGFKTKGTMSLIGRIEDEKKVQALEKAFAHLTRLVTGRKDLFPAP